MNFVIYTDDRKIFEVCDTTQEFKILLFLLAICALLISANPFGTENSEVNNLICVQEEIN